MSPETLSALRERIEKRNGTAKPKPKTREPRKGTQNAKVLAMLREAGNAGITQVDASREFVSTRLAARIHELRDPKKYGFTIVGTDEGVSGFTRYVLKESD